VTGLTECPSLTSLAWKIYPRIVYIRPFEHSQ
jgi:hypothetical protein